MGRRGVVLRGRIRVRRRGAEGIWDVEGRIVVVGFWGCGCGWERAAMLIIIWNVISFMGSILERGSVVMVRGVFVFGLDLRLEVVVDCDCG